MITPAIRPDNSRALRLIALEEFTRRYRGWQKARREGAADWPGDEANRQLTLWTAIAIATGVGRDLPHEVCAKIEEECLYPAGHKYLPCADRVAARLLDNWRDLKTARQLWLRELASERDRLRGIAEGSTDQRLIQRALDHTMLAEAHGCEPVTTIASFEGREAA